MKTKEILGIPDDVLTRMIYYRIEKIVIADILDKLREDMMIYYRIEKLYISSAYAGNAGAAMIYYRIEKV
mgnify:CR=1 FL=1